MRRRGSRSARRPHSQHHAELRLTDEAQKGEPVKDYDDGSDRGRDTQRIVDMLAQRRDETTTIFDAVCAIHRSPAYVYALCIDCDCIAIETPRRPGRDARRYRISLTEGT